MRNFKLTLAYDGRAYHGWQRQPGMETVQDTVEQAVRRVVRHQVRVIGAGRTDSGVHAAGQEANFWTVSTLPTETLFHAIGARLPKDVTLIHLCQVPRLFHATAAAVSKLYRYRVFAARGRPVETLLHECTYHFWHHLDLDAMRRAALHLTGTHDFTSMASRGNKRDNNIRTILSFDVYRFGREIRFDVHGTGFIYNQVRNMVGTLLEVGRGRWPSDEVERIITAKNRSLAGPTAPARGLCMQWVRYDLPAVPADPPSLLPPAEPSRVIDGAYSSVDPVMPPELADLEEEEPA